MEYAVSIAVVAIFITIYFLTRQGVRPMYYEFFDDSLYFSALGEFIKSLPLPKEGSKTDAKKYVSSVKFAISKLKMKRYGSFFEKFNEMEDEIKSLLKLDLSSLEELPSIDGEPRIVLIARFCLAHSDYKFSEDRVISIISEQNKRRTLSFKEILSFKQAFIYVLLEKLCYIYKQLDTLARVYTLAAKYVYNPILLSGKYKKLTKSKLFLSLCAINVGYKMDSFSKLHADVINSFVGQIKEIERAVDEVKSFDFSRLYTPLEILDKFEVFAGSPPEVKQGFLSLVQEASDKENLDEFMYVIRLEKYMQSASAGHISVKRMGLFSHTVCVIRQKRDMTMLAIALGSRHFMNLYFSPNEKKKNGKSISKMLDFENTFEPIYKFHTLNFGISTTGGKLKISPRLPRQIESADIVFDAYGVKNSLHILRGEEKELYLGNTKISGVEQIKLGDKPLDITLKISD